MNTVISKLSKPLMVALLTVGSATASLPAMAQHYHGGGHGYYGGGYYRGGGYHRGGNWLGAAIVTGVVGGLVYGAVSQPTYYSNPPVVYSQPYPVYNYPTYVAPPLPVRTYTWDPYLGRYVVIYR